MTAGRDCPPRELLSSLLLGTLPPEQEEAVTLHLEGCAACDAAAQELEQNTDPLIDALRRPKKKVSGTIAAVSAAEMVPDTFFALLDLRLTARSVESTGSGRQPARRP